jgi:tRNA(fMet)-specific endonuclease VapC
MKGDAELRDLLSAAGQVLVPSVVLGELRSGFRRGSREAVNLRQLEQFLAKPLVRVVDVSSDTAAWYAEVDFYLFSKGRPIPRNDVWIAALAMEHGAILLTRDAHFRELPLLPIRP